MTIREIPGKWRDDTYTKEGKVELVPIDFLKSIQGNELRHEVTGLNPGGLDEPVVIEADPIANKITLGEGNHRVEALRKSGYKYAPARVIISRSSSSWTGKTLDWDVDKLKNHNGYIPHDLAPSSLGINIRTER